MAKFTSRICAICQACQLKYPNLVSRFLTELEKQPELPLDHESVSECLKRAVAGWHHKDVEADNSDMQGVARFFGVVALSRFGIIEADPTGPLVFGKSECTRYSLVKGPSPIVKAYLEMDFGLDGSEDIETMSRRIRTALGQLPTSQLMGGEYINPWVARMRMICHGTVICTESTTVEEYLACFPDRCSWLLKLATGPDERMSDLCHRLGYRAKTEFLSATCCSLDDQRLLELLPAGVDLNSYLRSWLLELLVTRDAYVAVHGVTPCPYILFKEVFGKGSKTVSKGALEIAASCRARAMAALPTVQMNQVLHACPHEPRVSRTN